MENAEEAMASGRSSHSTSRRGPRADSYVPPVPTGKADLFELLKKLRPVEPAKQAKLFSDDPATVKSGLKPGQVIYTAGDESLLSSPCVAIVGTRAVTPTGAARARRLARELVEAGVVIVSGLAKGVDTEALTSAIESKGRVIAVIGTPLERAYPAENKRLQEEIYKHHLLISPFEEGASVQKHFFPQRNRVMAALSDATVIIEASDTSGTLHQAAECTRLGRWLFIAKSVMEDPKLKWPSGFKGYERTRMLSTTDDLLSVLR